MVTTRALGELDYGHVAELLNAANAAAFFTGPEELIDTELSTVAFRVRLAWAGRERELLIGEPNAAPELELVAGATRACLRDWRVFSLETMPAEERSVFLTALRSAEM